MRVVYVCTLERGGPLTHVEDLAASVAAAGVDVRAVVGAEDSAQRLRERGIESLALPVRHKLDLRGASAIWPLLRDATIVHTHDRRAGLLVRPQAPLRGAHAVHTLHGVPDELFGEVGVAYPPKPEARRLRVLWLRHGLLRMEAVLSYAGTVVVPSRALLEYAVRHGFPAKRMRHIPNALPVHRTAPGARSSRAQLGTVAILERRKGIDVLLDACARLTKPYDLHIYGDGSQLAQLQAQASSLRISVQFHGYASDARDRLDGLDVFILPTRGENLPVAIMEAMASALPVVATRVGGNPDLVIDGETGRLVPVDDPSALADALEWTLADENRRQGLGRNGAARLATDFNPDVIAGRMIGLYEELCESST